MRLFFKFMAYLLFITLEDVPWFPRYFQALRQSITNKTYTRLPDLQKAERKLESKNWGKALEENPEPGPWVCGGA